MVKLKTHNILDYVIAVVLVLAPFLFAFSDVMEARNVFIASGVVLALYSLITKYYYSLAKIIPLGVHMTLDCILGVVLLLAPQLFNYREMISNGQYAVHIIFGLGALGLVAVTRTRTEAAKTPEEHRATDGVRDNMQQGPQIRV
jgi:hypothetical protein